MTDLAADATGLAGPLLGFLTSFYRALDSGDRQAVANCFAPDGTWHRKRETLLGPAAVAAALAERDPARATVHILANFACSQGGEGWQTRYCLCVYDNGAAGECRLAMILDCTDTIIETGDGLRIRHKKSVRLLPTGG